MGGCSAGDLPPGARDRRTGREKRRKKGKDCEGKVDRKGRRALGRGGVSGQGEVGRKGRKRTRDRKREKNRGKSVNVNSQDIVTNSFVKEYIRFSCPPFSPFSSYGHVLDPMLLFFSYFKPHI